MKRQRRRSPAPRIDRSDRQLPATPDSDDTVTGCDDVLHALSENVRRTDAMITAAARLIVEPPSEGTERWDDDTNDDYLPRRKNHVAHLLESAKLAARAAIHDVEELEKCKA